LPELYGSGSSGNWQQLGATVPDPAPETFILELKPGPDAAQRRRGLPDRDPYLRLRKLLKYAHRECGFHVRFGTVPAGVELKAYHPEEGD
jgi:hypothetical protein